ncbi:MAG: hypothetical protein A3C93_04630 [Candidatus Lloydbacteria bacterium RIFCSPHIGHO2_02_FULL_54_17]|uniref:Uncharacterized protein n=1 Tax=Candidatus Lloydbacteria bacterium RIFCSPHIGHO2_02_FULL_54_17 TaxID=1798664 RepID=A0A1G2DHZ4_9BACT|nr:MAG: hypothetical protein A3C93_04630 [Candidatus Lloydbacteria bacterium RIFCSPHIGHO2_02_FULL_54_17]OGZ14697.1 MAG: hypothetical protein A2948_04310 [Candidatus Lloydbacteria bacterium RIFCSPLOWO2_01_FULL_54_18]
MFLFVGYKCLSLPQNPLLKFSHIHPANFVYLVLLYAQRQNVHIQIYEIYILKFIIYICPIIQNDMFLYGKKELKILTGYGQAQFLLSFSYRSFYACLSA